MRLIKAKKGILLTLVTLVLFILMLGELVTYIIISINYGTLSSTDSAAASSAAFLNYLSGSAPGFLSQSLARALSTLALYEASPSLRGYHFINNTALALQGLMTNGIIYGTNMSSYMQGATLQNYVGAISGRAYGTGSNISLDNLSIDVYQSSPFYMSARFIGSAILKSSVGTIKYPIYQIANVSLNGTTDLLGAQNGNPITIQAMPGYQFTNLIGNTLAASGSRSPYMFAYAPVIYSASGCPGTTPAFNYILATPSWTGSACTNMVGLVTDSAATPPSLPYLVYNSLVSSSANIPSGSYVLLNGAGLALLGVSGLQTAIQRGYYFGSNYSPSYLQLSELSTSRGGSGTGLFSFSVLGRQAANFNGANSYISTPLPTNAVVNTTIFAFFNTNSIAGQTIVLLGNNGGTNGYGLYIGGSNTECPSSTLAILESGVRWICASVPIYTNRWYNAALISTESGANVFYSLYLNGILVYTTTETLPIAPSGAMLIGNDNANRIFSGLISNVQIYGNALAPSQISSLYIRGLNSPPISNSSLLAWYPLSGNSNDYSGNNNNGTAYNVIYTSMPGYPIDPIYPNQLNRYDSFVVKGAQNCANLAQCGNLTLPHLYVGSRPLSISNGLVENETAALGIVNGSLPNAAFFNGGYVGTPSNQIYSESSTSPFSVGFWIYPTASGSSSAVVADGSNWAFQYSGSTLEFGPCGAGSSCAGASTSVQPNSWHFITGVFAGSSRTFQLYVNGSSSGSPATGNSIGTTLSGLTIGKSFTGWISDLQVYNSVLSSGNVLQLYQNNSVIGVAPIGYWPLSAYVSGTYNQTPGTPSGNNGTFYSSAGSSCSASNVIEGSCGAAISQP